jgi:hypothetical protein
MKRVNRPYHVDTETCSAFYEFLGEALYHYNNWICFYRENTGKYGGERTIKLEKNYKKLYECTVQ